MLTKEIPEIENISDVKENGILAGEYQFDKTFFKEIPEKHEGGSSAVFRLTNNGDVIYLTIFNHHDGYYSHGFTFREGEEVIKEGYL